MTHKNAMGYSPFESISPGFYKSALEGIEHVYDTFKQRVADGRNLSLDEVEKICSHVAILKLGNLLTYGPIESVLNNQEQVVVASENLVLLERTLSQIDGVSRIQKNGDKLSLILASGKDSTYLNKALFEKGIVASEISIRKTDLESNFLELIK